MLLSLLNGSIGYTVYKGVIRFRDFDGNSVTLYHDDDSSD